MKVNFKTLIYPESKLQTFLYLTASGIISGLCITFPTFFGAVLEWFSLIPAGLILYNACRNRVTLKKAYWGTFWLIYSQHLIVYHWFVSFYPLDFTGMSKLSAAGVVVIAIFGLSFLAALFSGLIGIIVVGVSRLRIVQKFPIFIPFVSASGYVLNEWIRTQFWFGVPWSRLSLGQLTDGIPYSVLSSSLLGSYFVTFIITLVSFLLAQAIFLKRIKVRALVVVLVVTANLITGIILANAPSKENTVVKVAAIQGNISSRDKWEGDKTFVAIFKTYYNLTEEAAKDGADLIVWPETSLPDNYFIPYLRNLCKEYGVHLLFGTFDFNENDEPGNALYLIDSNGELSENIYLKRHLVPFGEYVPMRNLIMTVFPPLGEIAMLEYDLLPGDDSNNFTINLDGTEIDIGCLICFDSIYEDLAYDTASDGADIICVATNDSWFEDSRAVYMHSAQSRLRTIENGIPVVRAANTGISTLFTEKGEVLESLEPLVGGYIISDVPVNTDNDNSYIYTVNEVFLWLMISVIYVPIVVECVNIVLKKRK